MTCALPGSIKRFFKCFLFSSSAEEKILQVKLFSFPMTRERLASSVPKSEHGETKNSLGSARFCKNGMEDKDPANHSHG